ncbi:acyl-CoA dehydrogenase family protein [Williamsia sp. CHRR-6]|uniref:acyl-CoA dehydrogenase family protein n=1 Tax=Williamsia sp. CHRR-6 TaxID=2835871 RepID=UPI001BD9A1DA|nr:acyl-CoA dehydrogenase family protein [Williamsia sp. CHRR-6]MBT0566843.1 acyl-CoA dehydrogenase family protein [Williamsia sp. CHRR-6]
MSTTSTIDITTGEELAEGVRLFIEHEVRPVEEKYSDVISATGDIPAEDKQRELLAIRRKSADAGFYTMATPEEFGGGGIGAEPMVHCHKAVGKSGLILASGVFCGVEGPSPAMFSMNEAQRAQYLDPVMRAEKQACFGLTEPGAGSDASNIKTRAVRDGDDWIINGSKQFITNGQYADFCMVVAVTDATKGSHGGITLFLVDMDTPGVSVGGVHQTLGEHRPADLFFDDVRVPNSAILGKEGFAFGPALKGINFTRLNVGAGSIGKSEYLIDRMLSYAKERHAFGTPIGKNQFVQGHIVDSIIETEAAWQLTLAAARSVDALDGKERILAASAKITGTELLSRVADRAIQVHGGMGVTTAVGVERFYRDARAGRLYEGTSELLRANIARWVGL